MLLQRLLGVSLAVLAVSSVSAQQWTGLVDPDIGKASNWTVLPANDGTAALTFTGAPAYAPEIGFNFDVASLTFESGLINSLTLSATGLSTLKVRTFIAMDSSAGQTISAPLELGASFIFKGNGWGYLQLTGGLSGTTGFTLAENADVRVFGNWNVTGPVTLQPETVLEIAGANNTVSNPITNHGWLVFGDSDHTTTVTGSIGGSGGVDITGDTSFGGTNTYSGTTYLDSGVTLSDTGAGAYSPNSLVQLYSNYSTLNVNHAQTIRGLDGSPLTNVNLVGNLTIRTNHGHYDGIVSGAGQLILQGTDSQTLGGSNTYSGGTVIQSGTLIATNTSGSATGTGPITINAGGTLQLGNNSSDGAVSGNIVNNGTVFFARDDAYTLNSVISGNGRLSVGFLEGSGSGILTLGSANTYTGSTQISAGTLRVGVTNALPVTTSIGLNDDATLDIAASQQVQRFFQTSGGVIQLGAGATLRIAPNAGDYAGTIEATVAGAGALSFSGTGGSTLTLAGNNSYSGGTTIEQGSLLVTSNGALGTGGVTIASSGGLLAGWDNDTTIANAISVNNGAILGGEDDSLLNLSGTVTLPAGAGHVRLQNFVHFSGLLQAAAAGTELTLESVPDSRGVAVLSTALGSNLTSLRLNQAGVIFGSVASVPATGSVAIRGTNGYVGIAPVAGAAPSASSVLSLIDKPGFTGTLGFDTPGDDLPFTVFSEDIDLSGFAGLSLGSATGAKLTGTITPSSSGYLFGNGGGALVVATPLTGAHGVTVASTTGMADNHLITILQGNNTFTGAVSVSNSALILDSAGALPAGRAVSLSGVSYLGYTENFTGSTGFLDFVSTRLVAGGYSATTIIGLDSATYLSQAIASGSGFGVRVVNDPIDLRSLGPIGFGTLTAIEVRGLVHAPAQGGANKTLSLTPVEAGTITIKSDLRDGQVNSVRVGSDATHEEAIVTLMGNNTYAGGTTLETGILAGGKDSAVSEDGREYGAFGTGTLTISSTGKGASLVAGADSLLVSNPIVLLGNLNLGLPTGLIVDEWETEFGSGWVGLSGQISGAGSLSLFAHTNLEGANTFTGGVKMAPNIGISLGSDTALGTGTLSLMPDPMGWSDTYFLSSYLGSRTLANNIAYVGHTDASLYLSTEGSMTFNGNLSLGANLEIQSYGGAVQGTIRFNGGISGPGQLTLSGSHRFLIGGTGNNPGGGFVSEWGAVIFDSAAALPSATGSLWTESDGYFGVSFVPADLNATFLSRFRRSETWGAIGFDTPDAASMANVFSHAIDLSTFTGSTRLGSASRAVLTGTITPRNNVYRFGNGGGNLEVQSNLGDGSMTRSLDVDSGYAQPLTLRLTGTNTFTGGGWIYGSGVVFGTNALPAVGQFEVDGGYIGTTDGVRFGATPQDFVDRIDGGSMDAIIGFDGMTVTGNIDLARFTASSPNIYLGTSTTATLSGGLLLPAGETAFRFAGYKGGHLTVTTSLADAGASARSVVIGSDDIDGAFLDVLTGTQSAVTLASASTYTGGTWLESGTLLVGHDNALGTGTVTISSSTARDNRPVALIATNGPRTLANAIALGGAGLDLGGDDDLTLSGILTGSAGFTKIGAGVLTLSDANSLSGSIELEQGGIEFVSGASVSSAALWLSGSGVNARFLDNTIVQGLYAYDATGTIDLTAGKTLTINQPSSSHPAYVGASFNGTTAGLIFTGGATRLSGASTFVGPVTISGTSVIAAGNQAFGTATNVVSVTNGILAVEQGAVVQNPVSLSNGTLAGNGRFKPLAGAAGYTIGSGAFLSPGMNGSGMLTFDGSLISTSVLILEGGGVYTWQLYDTLAENGADVVVVTGNVHIAATAADPFHFKFGSVDVTGGLGLASNFDPTIPYSWTVLSATSITGFTGIDQFNLYSMGFMNPNGGVFSLSLGSGGNSLMLNFNPVPEPSTYAMMLTGLGAIAWVYRRRRKP